MAFRSGFAALVGKTNVGKSTLFNGLVGQKVSIVSRRPQTTRNKILGVYTDRDCQIVFMDTPGIHPEATRGGLNRFMTRTALSAREEADVIALLVEAAASPDKLDEETIGMLADTKAPVILLINKIDTINKSLILPLVDRLRSLSDFHSIIPISALKGEGVGIFLEELKKLLPEGQPYFPEDTLTDQSERFIVGEIIRERSSP